MKLSALIAPLIAAKAPHETIMAVVEAYEQQQENALEKRRAADADRQARKRDREKSRDVTLRHSDSALMRDRAAPVDDKLKHTDTTKEKNTTAKDTAEFRSALASLGDDRLDALLAVRRAKKAPVNAYAAKLFVKAAQTCSLTLDDAADMCIERNWLTVKLGWLDKPQARGSPPGTTGKPRNMFDATTAVLAEMMEAENGTQPDPDGRSLEQNVRYLAIPQRQR